MNWCFIRKQTLSWVDSTSLLLINNSMIHFVPEYSKFDIHPFTKNGKTNNNCVSQKSKDFIITFDFKVCIFNLKLYQILGNWISIQNADVINKIGIGSCSHISIIIMFLKCKTNWCIVDRKACDNFNNSVVLFWIRFQGILSSLNIVEKIVNNNLCSLWHKIKIYNS